MAWDKIGTPKMESIWSTVDVEGYKKMLSRADFNGFEKLNSENRGGAQSVLKQVTCIFPDKKGNAINIALGRVKQSNAALKRNVLEINEKAFGENLLKQLIANFPTDSEMSQIEEMRERRFTNKNSETAYGKGELFYMECGNIPFLRQRLIAMHFRTLYPSIQKNFSEQVKLLSESCNALLENREIHKLIGLILVMVNVLNHGSHLGNASGFKISLLSKLSQVKSRDEGTVLHLVARKQTDLDFKREADLLGEASKISVEALDMEYLETKKMCEEMKSADVEEIKKYLGSVESSFDAISMSYVAFKSSFSRLLKFYGEKKMNEEIFGIFGSFLRDLSRASAELNEKLLRASEG